MKDKIQFYEIVNMFFVGAVFTLLVVLLCFESLPFDLLKDNVALLSDWAFLVSAVLLIAMYEIGFIINKAGSVLVAPILSKTKIWPRKKYHIDVSEISMKNTKFQSMITELILIRSHIMMYLALGILSWYVQKRVWTLVFIILIVVFILAGRKHNGRINTIRKDSRTKNLSEQCGD